MSKFNLGRKLQPATKAWKSFKTHLQSKLRHPKFVQAITSSRQRCRYIFPLIYRKFLAITKRRPSQSTRHLHHHHRHYFHPSVSAIYVDELFPQASPLQETSRKKTDMAGSDKFKPGLVTVSRMSDKIQTRENDKVGIKFHGGVAQGLVEEKGKIKDEGNKKKCDQWKLPLVPMFKEIDEKPGKSRLGLVTECLNSNDKVGIKFPGEMAKGKTKDEENSKKCDQWKVPSIPKFRGIDERAEEFIAKVRQDMKLEREQSIIEFEEMLKRSA